MDAELRRQGWYYDPAEADRVCGFIQTFCRHHEGEWAGQLVRLEPWQAAYVRRLFGWRRPNGTRRYRRSHLWVPRKNGKSTLLAALGLVLTVADNEHGAQVFAAAANKEQAGYVFNPAKSMVMSSRSLSEAVEIFKSSLWCPNLGSRFEVLSSKAETKHGSNPHAAIIDEIHAHTSADLYEVLTSGSSTRRQPLELVISTAGDDIGHFSYELWEYGLKCIQGVFEDPEFLPVIYAAQDEDDWKSEATWRKANPMYGVSIKPDAVRSDVRKAEGIPSNEAIFKQTRLNVWSQSTKAALSLSKWRECLSRRRLKLDNYHGREVFVGLDLSKTTDLTAMVLVFPNELPPEDPDLQAARRKVKVRRPPEYDVIPFFWCPADHAGARAKRDRVLYPTWIRQGFILPTEGDIVDLRRIRRDIRVILEGLVVRELAYDPYRAAALCQELQDEDGLPVLEFRQTYSNFTGPAEDLERLHVSKGLHIDPNPVLTWQASNVVWRQGPSGNKMPDKEKSRERIDGVVALLMALGRASVGRGLKSVYETRGIEVL
jgi:phage terminase large subunit-like protein